MRILPLITLLAAGCTGLAGLSDLTFEGQGGAQGVGGAAAGTGGMSVSVSSSVSSSSVGGAPGVLAVDWSKSLTGVYDFEVEDNLGLGTPGPSLETAGEANPSSGIVGSGAVGLLPPSGFTSAAPEFALEQEDNFTLMTWVRLAQDASQASEIVSRYSGGLGFSMDVVDDTAECFLGRGPNSGYGSARTAAGTVMSGAWAHIACTFNVQDGAVTAFVDGSAYDVEGFQTPSIASPGDLRVSSDSFPLTGDLDELVIHRGLLSESSIARIYACNVDGLLCRCDPNDPEAYLDCGRFDESCPPILPPCDQPAP